MRRVILSFVLLLSFAGCDREIEEPRSDFGFDYQPLEIGLFWTYEVEKTIYFGENDSETSSFFYRDKVRSFFINEEGEQVFVVDREKSDDQVVWTRTLSFTRLIRDFSFVENQENQTLVPLVFPPDLGAIWDGNIYQVEDKDDFEVVSSISFEKGDRSEADLVRVLQNDEDDEITFRDRRYEIYANGIGMVEKYSEVVTYCSRNDCLGQQLINSGEISLMKLVDYGQD